MVFQKMFINVTELKAKIPKPIVEIKNVLLISTKLVLHEIKSFERYFQRYVVHDVIYSSFVIFVITLTNHNHVVCPQGNFTVL